MYIIQLLCITTKETNFKVQALHESSMNGCQGAKIWNSRKFYLRCSQRITRPRVVIASDMNHCFCKTRIKAEIKKNYTETTCPDYHFQ